jgi:hypothetical protein
MEDIVKSQAVKIGEKYYDINTVTELAVALLKDIKKIDDEISRVNLKLSITKLAKIKLLDELTKELPKMTEVLAPETKEIKDSE